MDTILGLLRGDERKSRRRLEAPSQDNPLDIRRRRSRGRSEPARLRRRVWRAVFIAASVTIAVAVAALDGAVVASGEAEQAAVGGSAANDGEPRTQENFSEQSASWLKGLVAGPSGALLDSAETPLIPNLQISGFLQNSTGMWANSEAITYNSSKNSLAIERNLLQVDANWDLNPNNKFFLRLWGVYEPPYRFESGRQSDAAVNGPSKSAEAAHDFYNQYGAREFWWKSKVGPLTTFLGRQIVIWGESISFRVGDVVNPQDFSWNFGFANLEQSRLPLWMLHPVLSLPDLGPLNGNFLEVVYAPAWQPEYTNVDYPDDRYQGQYQVAGSVNTLAPFGGRFDPRPYPILFPAQARFAHLPPDAAAFPQFTHLCFTCPPEQLLRWRVPRDTWGNSQEGLRLHSLAGNAEVTAFYWHGHQYNPMFFVRGGGGAPNYLSSEYPGYNDIGVTGNHPLYLSNLSSQLPLVLRGEMVWQDRTPFRTQDRKVSTGVIYSSTINSMLALDLDQVYLPWLTRTGALTANLEWQNYTILSPSSRLVYLGYVERWRHSEENILVNVGTAWWWGAIAPTWTMVYNPDGNTTLLFPSLVLTPPWTDRYFLRLQYIGVLGTDKYAAYAGGVFKGKSILLSQVQYNFDLL